jgi:hypothetical protein
MVKAMEMIIARRKGSLLLGCLVGLGLLVIDQFWTAWVIRVDPFSPTAIWSVVSILPFVASPVALILAVAKNGGIRQMLRVALIPASILSALMATILLVTVIEGLSTLFTVPRGMDLLMLNMDMGLSSLVAVLVMGGTTILAVWALRRGFRELRMPGPPRPPSAEQVVTQIQQ